MTNTLFIGNLSRGTTREQILEHFAKVGKVLSVKVMMDDEGLGKGYGFVEFDSPEEAEKAKQTLNRTEIDGMKIEIKDEKRHG